MYRKDSIANLDIISLVAKDVDIARVSVYVCVCVNVCVCLLCVCVCLCVRACVGAFVYVHAFQ